MAENFDIREIEGDNKENIEKVRKPPSAYILFI